MCVCVFPIVAIRVRFRRVKVKETGRNVAPQAMWECLLNFTTYRNISQKVPER